MDWPPLMAFLGKHRRPEQWPPRRVAFTTVNPGISDSCHWIGVWAQIRSLEPSTVEATIDPATDAITATTHNVAALLLMLDKDPSRSAVLAGPTCTVDGQRVVLKPTHTGVRMYVLMRREDGAWVDDMRWNGRHGLKSPIGSGPFKEAFRQRFTLVTGTGGTPEENAWSLAKARYDAEVFHARGNASPLVVRDTDVLAAPDAFAGRNLVLYGNADTNRMWSREIVECPLRVERGRINIGDREFVGDDMGCLFVFPRPYRLSESARGDALDPALLAVVAGTGLTGMRATNHLAYFTSGVPFPDWCVLGADAWDKGIDGVRAAGFFTADWKLE
jgi:hypothetical protein